MKIPIFKLEFEKSFVKNYKKFSEKIFLSDSLSEGNFTKQFEKKFRLKNRSDYSLAISSGTAALEVAFRAINIKNFEVILPTNTFFGTSIPVIRAGGKVVLCDNADTSPEMCIEKLKKKITKKTKAICVVHVGGIIYSKIRELVNLCKQKKIYLVEDCAHSHFSSKYNIKSGNFGDIGCFSFFPTKVMTTGEGGMIVTKSNKLYNKMKSIKNFGRSSDPLILDSINGSNFKVSEFTSAVGLLELQRVNRRIKKRSIINRYYFENLSKSKFEVLSQDSGLCANYKCIVNTEISNSKIHKILKKKGISLTGKVWEIPLHLQKLEFKNKSEKFVNADSFRKKHICPPNYPELSLKEAEYICNELNKI